MAENEENLCMTACRQGAESIIRIERLSRRLIDVSQAVHVGAGPFKGIVINSTVKALCSVEKPSRTMSFTVCLQDQDNHSGTTTKETRELRFWFKQQVDSSSRHRSADEYFKQLLQPEVFPRDYVNFIKKAIVLCQKYPLLKRLEVVLRPTNKTESSYLQEETILRQSTTTTTYSQQTTRSRTYGRAMEDEELDEEEIDYDNMIQNFITVLTPAVYDYQLLPEVPVSRKRWVSFKVKAKSDAHIALSSVYGDTQRKTYEIVLGGSDNSKSMVRMGGQGHVHEEAVTLDLLDQEEARPFWVSWANHIVEVGRGSVRGEHRFLRCVIPATKQHSVNCMSVSTGPGSEGEWEFVEYIGAPPVEEDNSKAARRSRIRLALLWAAKKQKMLEVLEDAYPHSLDTSALLKASNVRLSAMMQAVVFLKDLQRRRLITEVSKGIWMRAPSSAADVKHDVRIVKDLPVLSATDTPSVALISAMFCEKLAVDAMMDDKVSFVRYRQDKAVHGESTVYTLGSIGAHRVVSVKLPRMGSARGAATASGNAVTRLLGLFKDIEHVVVVGVGGAVPCFSDPSRHVRLGDIVVSAPTVASGPVYLHCDKVEQKPDGTYDFTTRSWRTSHTSLHRTIDQLRHLQESSSLRTLPWDQHIERALEDLQAEESDFHRPPQRTDRLHALIDGKVVEVHHPEGCRAYDGKTHVNYGPVGSGKYVARNVQLRLDFSAVAGVAAYDGEFDTILEAIEGSRKDSYVLVRGMADYVDGWKNKDWAPYAAVCAAGYVKALITALPASKRGYY